MWAFNNSITMNNPNLSLAQLVEHRFNTEGPRFNSWMVDGLFVVVRS